MTPTTPGSTVTDPGPLPKPGVAMRGTFCAWSEDAQGCTREAKGFDSDQWRRAEARC